MTIIPIDQIPGLSPTTPTAMVDLAPRAQGIGETQQVEFTDYLRSSMGDVRETLRTAEDVTEAGIRGEAGVQEVAAAVNTARLTLETVTTVRNRLIDAYQEVMRMPL